MTVMEKGVGEVDVAVRGCVAGVNRSNEAAFRG
jgi:hypothetical protein